MLEQSFLPIIIGSDQNAYGMARAFYEEYRIKSMLLENSNKMKGIGRFILGSQEIATQNSRILNCVEVEGLDDPEFFVPTLEKVAQQLPNKKLILLVCEDNYAKLVIKNKQALQKYFIVPYTEQTVMNQIILKENFYKICEEYNLKYPKTIMVSYKNYETVYVPFEYPIIIKASNSVEYWKCSFSGKKKVFVAKNEIEKNEILSAIYSSSYKDNIIIQEFIPGDDSYMRVLNAYVGKDGKVKLMCLGNPILEDYTPNAIGNYMAIITDYDEELLNQIRYFLEDIGYIGFANFDMKYDLRDGQYKLFEINLRTGASSYYVTASGHNLMKYVVDDYVLNLNQDLTYVQNKHLWTILPKKVLFKYTANEKLQIEAKKLIKSGHYTNSLYFKEDINLKRLAKLFIRDLNTYRKYKKYFNKKELLE